MKYLILLTVIVSGVANALAVPFYNINLSPNQAINANFSFKPYSVIFCWESSSFSPVNLNWPLKGSRKNANLPVSLITNAIYQGSFADSSGYIIIQNNTNTVANVNCQFAF